MPGPVLATKLFRPPPRPNGVPRPGLVRRLDGEHGRGRALTLVSAPAGFGKTTLLSQWADLRARQDPKLRVAWLSLDEADSDLPRFLLYLAASLHGAEPSCGADAMAALQAPQPPSAESILVDLINEIDGISGCILLVLDDYHAVHSHQVDEQLAFLVEHRPDRLQLVVATREDPTLPLARLRACGELAELRAADLRFSLEEASEFLGRATGLQLGAEDIVSLESRTEGWIAGLQLAALSLREQQDVAGFIRSFTGSHRFVLDYLGEEVLKSQPDRIQTFLLRTSILDRFCGSLCDALVEGEAGQQTLEYLERANLFIVPLDDERKWYRYHRLFGELLRQRLEQAAGGPDKGLTAEALHIRASEWFENNGLPIDAFRHAAEAGDIDRAERLTSSRTMPLHYRDAVITVLDWLASLPTRVLDARPSLRVLGASMSLFSGRSAGVEDALQAAERSLRSTPQDESTRDLTGRIAAARATLALSRYQADVIMTESSRALEYLHADNLVFRLRAFWAIAFAHSLNRDRKAARRAYAELEHMARVSGIAAYTPLALLGTGDCQLLDNELPLAAQTYRRALGCFGDHPQPIASEMYYKLACILYEWNDLDAAEEHAERGLQLARHYGREIDRFILIEILLARIALARGRIATAEARLDALAAKAQAPSFRHRLPEIAAAQVAVLLRQGRVEEAAELAERHGPPQARARVLLAQEEPSEALAVLQPLGEQAEEKGWQDELLRARVLQALGLYANGREQDSLGVLAKALGLAEPAGFIRLFLDEGSLMAGLLSAAAARGTMPAYTSRLRAAFSTEHPEGEAASAHPAPDAPLRQALVEPLSARELEVLRLVAEGLSNQEIGERLFIALDTVKGHNRKIFEKLDVSRRTEAIARARELGLLNAP